MPPGSSGRKLSSNESADTFLHRRFNLASEETFVCPATSSGAWWQHFELSGTLEVLSSFSKINPGGSHELIANQLFF